MFNNTLILIQSTNVLSLTNVFNADLCGDLEDFVDDRNLFNVLEDVDMDLLGVGSDLSYENPENNLDFFIQDDQYNSPTSLVSSFDDASPLSLGSVSTQASPSVPAQLQPTRSSVIVGRSPGASNSAPKPVKVTQNPLNYGPPAQTVQIINRPIQTKQQIINTPQIIQGNI